MLRGFPNTKAAHLGCGSTASILPRTLLAVSGFELQIGFKIVSI